MDKEPSEAAFRRVDELTDRESCYRAFAQFVDKVDKVAREAWSAISRHNLEDVGAFQSLRSLMLPDEPDPLEEAYNAAIPYTAATYGRDMVKNVCQKIRAELKKRGLTIAEEK